MSIAFFDLDGTLIDADSNLLFFDHLLSCGRITADFLQPLALFSAQYFAGTLHIEDFIRYAAGPLVGIAAAEREQLVGECIEQRLLPALKPGARRTLDFHRRRGDVAVIVSATADYLVQAAAERLNIRHVLASPLRYDSQGALLGEVCGVCPYQEGKVIRIRQFLDASGLSLADAYAYGDSLNDLPMLQLCEHSFIIDAGHQMRASPSFGQFPSLSWRTPST